MSCTDTTAHANRRAFLTTGLAAVGAVTLTATPSHAEEPGPIEARFDEWRRRDQILDALPGDIPDDDGWWGDEPAEEAFSITPRGDREWAALMLMMLTMCGFHGDESFETIETHCGEVLRCPGMEGRPL